MSDYDQIFDTSPGLQEITELDLVQVQPDPNQPRQSFDDADLEELAASIREHGQLQPILVRPHPFGERTYIIIGGERRFRAFERLGLARIQAIIRRDVDEKKARELALVENLQRVDLSPFEEAAGYARLMEEHGYTQEQVAERMGKSRTSITGALALNRLPEKIKSEARATKVSKSKLVELAQLGDEKRQMTLWEKLKKGVTVAEAREEKKAKEVGFKPLTAKQQERRFRKAVATGRELNSELSRVLSDNFLLESPDDHKDLTALHSEIVELGHKIGQVLKSVETKKKRRDKAAKASQEEAEQPAGA